MKTENRHAKVGERILIVTGARKANIGLYKKGDVLNVISESWLGEGNVNVNVFGASAVNPDEYEVITEEDNHADSHEA